MKKQSSNLKQSQKLKRNTVEKIRAFIALPLSKQIKTELKALQTQLKKAGLKASWPRPDILHITIRFLGQLREDQIDCILACMEKGVSNTKLPKKISLSGVGVFPALNKPRILWVGFDRQTHAWLLEIEKSISFYLFKEMGIKMEKKKYRPHITVARIKQPMIKSRSHELITQFDSFKSSIFPANNINLYKSVLSASGATHFKIGSVPKGSRRN